jgi:hypothetical protein
MACGGGGGILVAWRHDRWIDTCVVHSDHAINIFFSCQGSGLPWWLVLVYGPLLDIKNTMFLDELRNLRPLRDDPWLLCGDFNLIYKASDKSNVRLNRRLMGKF